MMVKFVTLASSNSSSASVTFAKTDGSSSKLTALAAPSTYSVGTGWTGTVWTATLYSLQPQAEYSYWVTANAGGTEETLGPFSFKTSNTAEAITETYIAVLADHGTFYPLGFAVTDTLAWDNNATSPSKGNNFPTGPFDMAVVIGDLSYAYLEGNSTEIEYIWDLYTQEISDGFAKSIPVGITVGNHDSYHNFAAISTRFTMPGGPSGSGSDSPFWYSYDYQGIHFISMSSEHDYTPGSPQRQFLEADLARASDPQRKMKIPWIILLVHRPLYSSESSAYDQHSPGAHITTEIGGLLDKYEVPLCLTGHMHSFEYTHAIYNGSVAALPQGPGNVYSGNGTIYVVQGTSGAIQLDTMVKPQPEWSAFRTLGTYGYGRLRISNSSFLSYEFVDLKGSVVESFSIMRQA